MRLKKLALVSAAALAAFTFGAANAADFPRKPVTIVVGYGAGGGTGKDGEWITELQSVQSVLDRCRPRHTIRRPYAIKV